MNNVKKIKEKLGGARKEKARLEKQQKKVVDKMNRFGNKGFDNLSKSEKTQMDELVDEGEPRAEKLDELKAEIENLTDKLLAMDEDPNLSTGGPGTPGWNGWNDGGSVNAGNDVEIWKNVSDEKQGSGVKVLGPRASFGNGAPTTSEGREMGEYLRDRIRGYTENGSFSNAMDTTTDSALVPRPLSDNIVDLARNKSRVIQAGAQTVEMDSKTLTVAKMTKDPQANFKEENAAIQESDGQFGPLTFEAHTCVVLTRASVELAEDAPGFGNQIANALASQIALKLDHAAMLGSGTGAEPTGIINTPDVQMTTLGSGDGGPLTDYSEFSKAYQAILAANGQPNAVIYSPRTWGETDRLTASDGQPLMAPQSYKDLEKYQTQQVPDDLTMGTSDNASLAIVGDWRNCLIGIRTKMRLETTYVGTVDNASAFENLQVLFRAYARYDVQLAHPEHFYVINGIVPA